MVTIKLRYVDGMLAQHYGFNELQNVGDEVIYENGYTQLIRQSLYSYGTRHGMKFYTKCLGKSIDGGFMNRTYVRRIR